MKIMKQTLKIEFPSEEAMQGFICFMSRWGEQAYWEWIGAAERFPSVTFEYQRDEKDEVYLNTIQTKKYKDVNI